MLAECRSLSPEADSGESSPLLEKESLEKAAESGSYYEITQITEMGQANHSHVETATIGSTCKLK